MKTMSFLAGVAAGVLLHNALSRRGGAARHGLAAQPATGGRRTPATVLVAGNEPDEPTHAPPHGDDEIRDRIRAQLARTISDPDAVQVEVSGGCVTLTGQVHARDSVLLMAEVENTGGVVQVRNGLQILGSLADVAPPMTSDRPAVRAGERASSHMT